MITKIAPEKIAETETTGKLPDIQLPPGYLKVTGYSNRATQRAQLKAQKKKAKS